MKTNKNIFLLPTDKPSRLYSMNIYNGLRLSKNGIVKSDIHTPKNIYITSDEEIKEGDYVTNGKYVSQAINEWWTKFYIGNPELKADYWKIVLTTDQELIKDGVQAIDDNFLEWFVKNPSCEEVEFENIECQMWSLIGCDKDDVGCCGKPFKGYKIIIPQEEPKQEETGKWFADNADLKIIVERPNEERYSEDEVRELLIKALTHDDYMFCGSLVTKDNEIRTANFNIWFEEYKKK
jgi:hypothetical protein